jgi:hypothetical protein
MKKADPVVDLSLVGAARSTDDLPAPGRDEIPASIHPERKKGQHTLTFSSTCRGGQIH